MNKNEMAQRLKGRNSEQQKVIKYFYGDGGCFGLSAMKDEEYDSMVMTRAKSVDFKQKALSKIGLDISQVSEIEPVHFENYFFDEKKTFVKFGKDLKTRSSAYQITWIFFSSTQIYIYQYTFNMDEDGKKEQTEEYFYKDITNFSTTSDTIEKPMPVSTTCQGEVTYGTKNVDTNRFQITVPGDKFYCAMAQSDYSEKSIQGMKAKLREKKG